MCDIHLSTMTCMFVLQHCSANCDSSVKKTRLVQSASCGQGEKLVMTVKLRSDEDPSVDHKVEVLLKCGKVLSAVVRLVGCTVKPSKTTLEMFK